MTTIQAIRKAMDELGTNVPCREIWKRAEELLGGKIGKAAFFSGVDTVMDQIKGRASVQEDVPPAESEKGA
jgi:hypothetical protein